MRLSPSDETFIANVIEQASAAIRARAKGDPDREWELTQRLSQVLAAEGYALAVRQLGLVDVPRYDTLVEILVNGKARATHEAGALRNDLWTGAVESVQAAVQTRVLREHIMLREELGADALPPLQDDEESEEEDEDE